MKVTTLSLLSAIALSISSTLLIAEEPTKVGTAATVGVEPAMQDAAPAQDALPEGTEVKKECITIEEAEEMAKASAEAPVDGAKADDAKDGEAEESLPLCEEEKPAAEGAEAPAEASADAPAEGEKAEAPAEEAAK